MADEPVASHDTSRTSKPLHAVCSAGHPVLPHLAPFLGSSTRRRSASRRGYLGCHELPGRRKGSVAPRVHRQARRRRRRGRRNTRLARVDRARRSGKGSRTDLAAGGIARTARDLRKRVRDRQRATEAVARSTVNRSAIARSPILRFGACYLRPSMISSSASFPGRTRSSGSVASGSSTTFSCVRKSSRSGSM